MDWNDFDYGQYDVMADMLMDKYPDIDGIFAVDMVAIACIRQLLKRKKKVPRDVKVVAYDGTYVAKVGVMNLTVVQQPIEELAKRAVNILLNMIQGKSIIIKKYFISLHYFWEIRQMIKNNTWKKVLQFILIEFVQNKQK